MQRLEHLITVQPQRRATESLDGILALRVDIPGGAMTRSTTTPRLYTRPWHRWAWAAVPLLSITTLTFVPFLIAWRRRVVTWPVAAVYAALSGTVIGLAIAQAKVGPWFTAAAWAYIIAATIHLILLDRSSEAHEQAATPRKTL